MTKSINLCFHKLFVCSSVIKKLKSYPYLIKHRIHSHTFTAFLLRILNSSARCIKNLENLSANTSSNSSDFFNLIEIRTLLILASISVRSFSLRLITRGFNNNSLSILCETDHKLTTHCASISGLL